MRNISECMEVARSNGWIVEVERAALRVPLKFGKPYGRAPALMPPRRRVSFLLGGAISSSML
jgi:hypothetical protein